MLSKASACTCAASPQPCRNTTSSPTVGEDSHSENRGTEAGFESKPSWLPSPHPHRATHDLQMGRSWENG